MIADMENISVFWKVGQTTYNIQLSPGKVLSVFNSMKAERGKKPTKEEFESTIGWFMKVKEESHLYKMNVSGGTARADKTAGSYYPEDLL